MRTTRARVPRCLAALALGGMLVGLAACGQRGALYLPDRNARVVTHPAASAPAAASAPESSSAPH